MRSPIRAPSAAGPRPAVNRGFRATRGAIALSALLALALGVSSAADPTARREWSREVKRAFDTIETKECYDHVAHLASDALEGREAGEEGGRLASEYIAMRFLENGLEPGAPLGSYFQPFPIAGKHARAGELSQSNTIRLVKPGGKGEELELLEDFAPIEVSGESATGGEIIYLSQAGAEELPEEVAGKVIVITEATLAAELARPPEPAPAPAPVPTPAPAPAPAPAPQPGSGGIGSSPVIPPAADIEPPLPLARLVQAGVRGVIVVTDDKEVARFEAASWPAGEMATAARIPVVRLTQKSSEKLLRLAGTTIAKGEKLAWSEGKGSRALVSVSRRGHPYGMGRNVIGVLRGTDPAVASEMVVIGAHFDHVGYARDARQTKGRSGEIHNGADDNASGTTGLIELSEAFAKSPDVARGRTLVFIAFDGEEHGLVGSFWYVAHCPFPIEKTVAMINMDMISRNGPQEMFYGKDERFPGLNGIVEGVASYFRIELDRTGMDEYMERSDQAAFLKAGIPAVFLYGGDHPQYHTEKDDLELINPIKIQNIARLMFLCAYECANHGGSFKE